MRGISMSSVSTSGFNARILSRANTDRTRADDFDFGIGRERVRNHPPHDG